MRRAQLPISALPAWMKLNDVILNGVKVEDLGAKGFGLVAEGPLSSEDTSDIPAVLNVPMNLILSTETVEEYARVDKDFRELLNAAGGISTRGDILLFLLMQITIASPDCPRGVGVSNPWTEYVKLLPSVVPVPTMWADEHCRMLMGTSLESPLIAKKAALLREFERLRDVTSTISWAQKVWWEKDILDINDWILLDAWYRSRCLELPVSGISMVPCLDLVNHATDANASYEQTSNPEVVLLLRPNQKIEASEEISINYGSAKSAAEMLFSYGFIGDHFQTSGLVLDLHLASDDPLGKAKAAAFQGAPAVKISAEEGTIQWSSPFLFLICLNEEDGLEFRTLQQVDGPQGRLQVFWQGNDVTRSTENFQEYTSHHPLKDIFALRAVTLLQDRVLEQLDRMYSSEKPMEALANTGDPTHIAESVMRLRSLESVLLRKTLNFLESQRSTLLDSPAVTEYLGSTGDMLAEDMTNDEDFS